MRTPPKECENCSIEGCGLFSQEAEKCSWYKRKLYSPQPYDIVRHFKGNHYMVMHIAQFEYNMEKVVVYKALYKEDIYVRPLKEFISQIDPDRIGNVTKQFFRFEKVTV